jgi:hypothetical protein
MSTIVLRSVKGTPLSNTEVDTNFSNLNTDKTELGGTYSAGTANGVLFLSSSKVLTSGSALTFDGTALAPDGTGRTLGTTSLRWGTVFATAFADGTDQLVGSSGAQARFGYGASWTSQSFAISGSEQMRLTSTGLGIGTSSPSSKLDVSVADAGTASKWIATSGRLRLRPYADATNGAVFESTNTAENAYLPLSLFGSSVRLGNGAQVIIDSSGNLGIGTSSPDTKFDVRGNAQVRNADNTQTTLSLLNGTSYNSSTLTNFVIGAQNSSSVDGGRTYQFNVGISGTALGKSLTFSTVDTSNGTVERMRLDSSGNLGLGVTPSAWWSGSTALQIGLGGYVQGRTGTAAAVEIGSNQFINSSIQRTYIQNGAAAYYEQSGGNHQWFTAPSGTAGDAISFSQAMTLDASGNLGVGTTSPSNRLHVAGSATTQLQVQMTGQADMRIISDTGYGALSLESNMPLIFRTNATERARIDSSGNLIQTVNTTAATLATNGTLTFSIVDNSTLRISVRGSDGTTRTATVALT